MSKNIIIILMYNDYESTIDLVNSIKEYQELEKIIIVDNCSVDDSYEKLKAYESEHIHVIKTDSNGGFAAGNNYGAQYAKKICPDVQNYIFSNPDVIVNRESIAAMDKFLSEYPKAGAVCPMELTREHEMARNFAWKLPTYWQMILSTMPIYIKIKSRSEKPYLWYYDVNEAVKHDIFWTDVIVGCFIMISRKAFEEVDGFSERTFLYHEEDIIAYRFKEKGIKLAVLPQYKIVHLGCTSMNITYKSWEKKSDVMFDSSVIYLEDCLKTSKFGIAFYRFMYKFGVWQRKVFRALMRKEV